MVPEVESLTARFDRDFRPALISFFMRRVGSRAEAEDLTHDVFLRLVSSSSPDIRDVQAYVFRIAANLLRDRVRREMVRNRYERSLDPDADEIDRLDPHRIAAGRESLSTLVAALDELPERTRRIFLLFRYEQVSRQAISDSFGISVSAVDKHIYRAIALLSVRLERGA